VQPDIKSFPVVKFKNSKTEYPAPLKWKTQCPWCLNYNYREEFGVEADLEVVEEDQEAKYGYTLQFNPVPQDLENW